MEDNTPAKAAASDARTSQPWLDEETIDILVDDKIATGG